MADVAVDALFQLTYVDEAELAANVRRLLQRQSQISLPEVVRRFPISKGVAELVGYLNLATKDEKAMVDPTHEERLQISSAKGGRRWVRLPRVLFTRQVQG